MNAPFKLFLRRVLSSHFYDASLFHLDFLKYFLKAPFCFSIQNVFLVWFGCFYRVDSFFRIGRRRRWRRWWRRWRRWRRQRRDAEETQTNAKVTFRIDQKLKKFLIKKCDSLMDQSWDPFLNPNRTKCVTETGYKMKIKKKLVRFEPGTAGWEDRTLPLCYAIHPTSYLPKC